jgi:outer membrane receptor protein involved in Fe transport
MTARPPPRPCAGRSAIRTSTSAAATLLRSKIGRDDVRTVGTGVAISTRDFKLARGVSLKVSYGLDAYFDTLASKGWNVYHDSGITSDGHSQYTNGARYLTSGLWTEAKLSLYDRLELRGGGRGVFVVARAPVNEEFMRGAVDERWGAAVGGGGAALKLIDGLRWLVNLDQGFRAPNLDDLTGQQWTGAGFQLQNAGLKPERALSLETGLKLERPRVEFAVFGFQSWIKDLILKYPVSASDYPACMAGTCLALLNGEGTSVIRGFEGALRLFLPAGFGIRATLAYTWGDGPHPSPETGRTRAPLSRIPPLNGTAEVSWRHSTGVFLASAMRWARAQRRLNEADEADSRIPPGGTPGFAVLDMRAGYRFQPYGLVTLVLENVTNAAYRYHGSSINGPGRSLNVLVELGF